MYSSYQVWIPGSKVPGKDIADPDWASLAESAIWVHGPFGSPLAETYTPLSTVVCAGAGGPSFRNSGDWITAYSASPLGVYARLVRPMSVLSRPSGAIRVKVP